MKQVEINVHFANRTHRIVTAMGDDYDDLLIDLIKQELPIGSLYSNDREVNYEGPIIENTLDYYTNEDKDHTFIINTPSLKTAATYLDVSYTATSRQLYAAVSALLNLPKNITIVYYGEALQRSNNTLENLNLNEVTSLSLVIYRWDVGTELRVSTPRGESIMHINDRTTVGDIKSHGKGFNLVYAKLE